MTEHTAAVAAGTGTRFGWAVVKSVVDRFEGADIVAAVAGCIVVEVDSEVVKRTRQEGRIALAETEQFEVDHNLAGRLFGSSSSTRLDRKFAGQQAADSHIEAAAASAVDLTLAGMGLMECDPKKLVDTSGLELGRKKRLLQSLRAGEADTVDTVDHYHRILMASFVVVDGRTEMKGFGLGQQMSDQAERKDL